MKPVIIAAGTTVRYLEDEWTVEKVLSGQKLFLQREDETRIVSVHDLSSEADDNEPPLPDLSTFDKAAVEEAERRYNMLDAYYEDGTSLSEIARENGEAISTVHDWFLKREEGGILRFLQYPRSDKGTYQCSPLVKQTVDLETHSKDTRPVTTVIAIIRETLDELANDTSLDIEDRINLKVSDSTLRRMINERREMHELDLRHDAPLLPSEHLMHEVLIDHSKYGMRLIDQYRYRTVNPVLTHGLGAASRFAWAVVGGAGPNSVTYGRIFTEISVPHAFEHVPSKIFTAVPHIIYTDHGSDLVSKSVRLTLAILRI